MLPLIVQHSEALTSFIFALHLAELHVQVGPFGFLFDTRLYLREKKIRQLNWERSKDKRLSYCSKYTLVREMLL